MSGVAKAQDISAIAVHRISEGTEIGLTVLSFAIVVALLATIIMGLTNCCEALSKKLVSRLFTNSPRVDERNPG
jgi:uncharacterized protein YneF (UPF0154 family)